MTTATPAKMNVLNVNGAKMKPSGSTVPRSLMKQPIAQGLRPLYGAAAQETQPNNNQGIGAR
jgi:hypothetical protein